MRYSSVLPNLLSNICFLSSFINFPSLLSFSFVSVFTFIIINIYLTISKSVSSEQRKVNEIILPRKKKKIN